MRYTFSRYHTYGYRRYHRQVFRAVPGHCTLQTKNRDGSAPFDRVRLVRLLVRRLLPSVRVAHVFPRRSEMEKDRQGACDHVMVLKIPRAYELKHFSFTFFRFPLGRAVGRLPRNAQFGRGENPESVQLDQRTVELVRDRSMELSREQERGYDGRGRKSSSHDSPTHYNIRAVN